MVAIVSPLWRWLVTDLCSESITLLDHLASDRTVTPKLNEPLELTGTVPSDNSEVNRLHTDGYPFLNEGVRLIYGFRREDDVISAGHPYIWTIRASTLVLQVTDAAESDDARTRFTAWDAWQYLMYRPIWVTVGEDTSIVPREGHVFTGTVNDIIFEILNTSFINGYFDAGPPEVQQPCGPVGMFADFGQTGFWTGTFETCRTVSFRVEPGMSVGQALQDLCTAGYCDIVFEPIYDPVNRPGYLNQISVYAQDPSDLSSGVGDYQYGSRFAWDRPGRSMTGVENLFDGTQRANYLQFARGQAGKYVTPVIDGPSISTYGEYWAQQFFPQQPYDKTFVEDLEAMQSFLRSNYKETLTVHPAPERAPEPFVDYNIGDRVPVYISDRMRWPLPPYWPDATPTPVGDPSIVWQRVYGIPVDIDDNGTETVRELLVGPVGAPPVPTGPGAPGFRELGTPANTSGLTTAVETAGGSGVRTLRRGGTISRVAPFRRTIL